MNDNIQEFNRNQTILTKTIESLQEQIKTQQLIIKEREELINKLEDED